MNIWRNFLDSLATDGGFVFLLFSLVVGCLCYLNFHPDAMKAGEVLTGAFGALLMFVKQRGTNRQQLKDDTLKESQ